MIYVINTLSFGDGFFDEIKEAEKKIFYTDKVKRGNKHTLWGRVLLGYILKNDYGIESFFYRYGENGKPYLENENLFFNISHSGQYIVCCVSNEEIGCDVEEIKEYNPKIAKRFFTRKETELIENSDIKERAFTRLWTLKESILKKEGTGIGGGLDTYCFAENAFDNNFTAYGCNFICCSFCGFELSVCSAEMFEDIKLVSHKEFIGYVDEINLKST